MEESIQRLLEALEKRRQELGSLRAVSEEINVPFGTLKGWRGGKIPSETYLSRLLEHFGISSAADKVMEVGLVAEVSAGVAEEARERTEKIKHLLVLAYYELRWFIEAPKKARDIFRENISLEDVGYLGSLLTMLGEEDFFQRWKKFSTASFSKFSKGGEEVEKGSSSG